MDLVCAQFSEKEDSFSLIGGSSDGQRCRADMQNQNLQRNASIFLLTLLVNGVDERQMTSTCISMNKVTVYSILSLCVPHVA